MYNVYHLAPTADVEWRSNFSNSSSFCSMVRIFSGGTTDSERPKVAWMLISSSSVTAFGLKGGGTSFFNRRSRSRPRKKGWARISVESP